MASPDPAAVTGTRAALTIGQFARRSGLSQKALRLYDLSGLLPPARVDPVSGYRLYAPEQLVRARRISLLRQLDMPLVTVAEVLSGSDQEAVRRLDHWWAEQEATLRSRRAAWDFLRGDLLHAGEPDAPGKYRVGTRVVPDTKVACVLREVDQHSLVPTMISATEQILRHLGASGADFSCENWWIYHGLVTPDSEAPVEACVPFGGTVDPAGPITIRVEPAHTEAYCTITRRECGFPQIMAAYDAVERWIRQQRRDPAGPAREVYFADPTTVTDETPFTHIAIPILAPAVAGQSEQE